jgi:hypothetical protein
MDRRMARQQNSVLLDLDRARLHKNLLAFMFRVTGR